MTKEREKARSKLSYFYYDTLILMRKPIVVAIVVSILVVGGGTGAYLWMKKTREVTSPAVVQLKEQTQTKLLAWNDPAGFTFQYPQGLTTDKHDEDKENYAHVELTKPTEPGRVIVWAKDTTAVDVSAWVKTEKQFAGASILDTTLGGQPAKKILLLAPSKKVIIGTIFDGLLWEVETETGEGDFWTRQLDAITRSFSFTPTSSGALDNAADTGTVDEEEVIE